MKRNLSVDFMRIIAAILVVIIHTPPFTGIHPLLTYSVVDVLPRIAVPFFFAISGYYFINSPANKQLKQILNIIKEYVIVTIAYLAFSILISVVTDTEFEFSIFNFFTSGIEYHLWFFPALIYSMIFFYLWNNIFKNKAIWLVLALSMVLFLVGILSCSYYNVGIKIPGLALLFNNSYFEMIRRIFLMGFVFFASGYLASYLKNRFAPATALKVLISFFALFLIEIYVLYYLKIYDTVVITLFLYPLTVSLIWYLVSNPLYKSDSMAKYCKETSMTMYYYHPMVLTVLCMFCNNETINFFVIVILFLVIGFIKNYIIKQIDKSKKEKVEKANV